MIYEFSEVEKILSRNMSVTMKEDKKIVYPDSDGMHLTECTRQFEWMVLIKLGLEASFKDNPEVFFVEDLFRYVVEGRPDIRQSPDLRVNVGQEKLAKKPADKFSAMGIAPASL